MLSSDPAHLQSLADAAERRITEVSARYGYYETTLSEENGRFLSELPEGDNSAAIQAHNQRIAADHVREVREQLVASSEGERKQFRARAKEWQTTADAAALVYDAPVSLLKREGLGDARRANLQTTLAGAGPAELRTYAATAVATKDVVLAAAVATVIDRMSNGARKSFTAATGHSSTSLAAAFFATPFKNAQANIKRLRAAAQVILSAEDAFVRNRQPSAADKIRAGLAQRAAAAAAKPSARDQLVM